MRKSIFKFLLLIAVLIGGSSMAFAQSKALTKDIKKTTKEWKKAGWSMLATASTMEYALTKYRTYIEADEDNHLQVIGIAVGNNPKIGRENAMMNGISNYAARAKAQVIGKLKSIMSSEASGVSEEEIDKFGAAYEISVNQRLSGLVKHQFVLVRDNGGKKEFQSFMSLDESLAKKAREDAARDAKKKASLGDLSTQVEEFIGEPVEPEE